jgi:predicted nucleotidyltransferase component of viral defense system
MITTSELRNIAALKRLSVRNTEKDYLLELLLYAVSEFNRVLVFKGGTALYKFYNLNRFSEDLDFDAVGKRYDGDALIKKIVRNLELTGMQRTLSETKEHGNEINVRLTVRGPLYDGSKESMSRVSLNLSKRERPTLIQKKLLVPTYQEIPSFELLVLDASEIAAEKIRCIMTREKPRDIHDLWFLSKRGVSLNVSLIDKKLKLYDLMFDQVKFFLKVQEKRNMWTRDLNSLVIGVLPKFDDVVAELKAWCSLQLQ